MQFQMSSVSAPSPTSSAAPSRQAPGPEIVRPQPRKPRKTWLWLILVAVAAVAASLIWVKSQAQRAEPIRTAGGEATRTAPVLYGSLEKRIRVTGTVQAERFAAIMAPQMFGSRSGRGRDGGGGGPGGGGGGGGPSGGRGGGSAVASGGGRSGGGGSPSSSLSGGGGGSRSGGLTGNAGGESSAGSTTGGSSSGMVAVTSSLGPTRGTTNRFSGSSSGSSTSSSSSSSVSSSSAESVTTSVSSSGGGSGGGGGGGGGGMGGGMSDFMMVLLECAKPGIHVKKGDVVGEFDRQYQQLRVDDYRASIVSMEANFKKQKADLAVALEAHAQQVRSAKADLDKALLDLKTIEVRSANEAEAFKLSAEEAQARYKELLGETALVEASQRSQIKASEIDRNQAKIELQRAQNNVQRMILKAPIDGIVVMQSTFTGGDFRQYQQGDQVYPGQFFMSIVDPSSMVINAAVNQVDSEQLRIGMKAMAHFDAYPDIELPATIVSIGAMSKSGNWRASWVGQVPIRLRMDKLDPRVIPDLSASADIVLATEKQAAMAPLESVFRDTPESQPYVYLRRSSGFEKRPVELGLANNIAVAVYSGLRKGDVVACQRPVQGQNKKP